MTDTFTSEFEEFISDENLCLAWERLMFSMHRDVKDRLGLQAYAPQIDTHIQILQESLKSGYKPSDAYSFFKTKQDRSLRRFSFLTMDDRFVYQALCNVLIENSYNELSVLADDGKIYANIPTPPEDKSPYVFERIFANRYSTSAGQYDKFRGQVLRSKREFVENYENPWLVRTDVRSYFPSIDHGRLYNLLKCRKWLADKQTRQILMDCLKKWDVERGKGIPIGYECSDHIGNVFLIPLDEALANFKVHRYVDDIYIYVENFERAKEAIYIVDEILEKLSLQRNTLKTEFLNLHELSDNDLKERLTESLSQLVTERTTEASEQQRERELLGLLEAEFDAGLEKPHFRGRIENISTVAFVLYRFRRANEKMRRLAFHVLDHHPNYSFHAMTYLYQVYRRDPEVDSKLSRMFEAEYEAEDVKANALKFLSLIDNGSASNGYVDDLFENSNVANWHLIYLAMRDVIHRNCTHRYSELLTKLAKHPNPFLSAYAASRVFSRAENEVRIELVRSLLRSESEYARKIGLYLAYLYEVDIDPSPVPCSLEGLMTSCWLGEKDSFHKSIRDLFHINLLRDFPIEKYFGETKQVNQTLRDIRLNLKQGIDDFLQASKSLVNVFFEHRRRALDTTQENSGERFPDDNELTSLRNNLEPKSDVQHKWKNGKQAFLLSQLRRVMQKYLMEVQEKEGLIVRDKIFISYSSDDENWRDMLLTAIYSYFGQNPPIWYFKGNLEFSDAIRQKIIDARSRTKVAILLTSNSYFASEPVMELEFPYFKEKRDHKKLKILWLPCEPSSFDLHGLGDVWTPVGKEPLTGKSNHDCKIAFDLAARKLHKYFHPNDSTSDN